MVRLLERQANIVPEHLFTKDDVREIVRKELQKQESANTSMVEASEEVMVRSNFMNTMFCGVTAMVGGAGLVVFRRACLVNPEMMWGYVYGAWNGAACGLVGSLVVMGVLKRFGVGMSG